MVDQRTITLTPAAWRALAAADLETRVARERHRQRGWRVVCAGTGAPAREVPLAGELVYGPPGAHLGDDEAPL